MQINRINTQTYFGAHFSSTFNKEVDKLKERIYTNVGKNSSIMHDFKNCVNCLSENFDNGRIVTCKKGVKGTFLEIANKKIARLSKKYKKYSIKDMEEIAHKIENKR